MPYASRAAGATPAILTALFLLAFAAVAVLACGGPAQPPPNDSTSVTVSHGALAPDAAAPAESK